MARYRRIRLRGWHAVLATALLAVWSDVFGRLADWHVLAGSGFLFATMFALAWVFDRLNRGI